MTPTSEIDSLLHQIDEIDRISDEQWNSSLNERKRKELEFHDCERDKLRVEGLKADNSYDKFFGNRKYYSATQRSNRFLTKWIAREAKGKIFLDYACGNGGLAITAAKAGAALSLGFDISGVSVENARASATEQGIVDRIRFFQADAENTKLPDKLIDVAVCSGMLHHLDLSYAFPELRRILKPGGKILAVEALDYNPAIKLYRYLTPAMRTDWEKAHILDLADVKFASRFFTVKDVRFWHVIGYLGGKIPWFLPIADAIDQVLEKTPYLQRMAWIFTFVLERAAD